MRLAPEMTIPANLPQTLIVHTKDDKNYELGSALYDAALTAANIPHRFLLYDNGGHGWGLRSKRAVKVWPNDATAWLRKIGIL